MKTLVYLFVIAMLLFAGCEKDEMFNENMNIPELKKAKVPIPLKGEICMIDNEVDRIPVHFGSPDGPVVSGATVVRNAFLYGNLTHMGKLDEQSSMTGREGAYLDAAAYSEGKIIVVATYDGRLFAANGDYIDLVSNIRIDRGAQTISADYTITGGSGRFENAAGNGFLSGLLPCWDSEGTIVYSR